MDIERELERVIEKNKDRKYSTFETRVELVAQDCLQEIRRLKQIIELYQETSQWISVEDRLPDGDVASVLIYTKEGGVAEGQYYPSIKSWKQFRWSVENSNVTHWMPLPNPPKESR